MPVRASPVDDVGCHSVGSESRGRESAARPSRVLLWPDTFNNHFHPDIGMAAVDVLEAAGFEVALPTRPLCCGQPLYEFGMLSLAKRMLRQVMDKLRTEIEAGTPIIVLEPSCHSVFRDELLNLFPRDEHARRLAEQSNLFGEFLERHVESERLPRLSGLALLHGHCHQKALFGMDTDQKLLTRLGIDAEVLDSGCCGMAGPFGFEKEKYDIAMAAGERVLLPAAREARPEMFLVADGFSCREQIAHGTGRKAMHIAEVMCSGLRHGSRT